LPDTAPAYLSGTPPTSLPGVASGLVPGAQFPANIAPPGSPLVSPAGFGPSVPGTPIPQGQIPGANVLPASPTQLPSLANRAPALLPHAVAGNGVPDNVLSVAPAFEPRLGGTVLGVPQQVGAPLAPSAADGSGIAVLLPEQQLRASDGECQRWLRDS
jgi:cysteine desulfurase/selenocysteine lyase